jgi:N-terminal acetyltransferase B complex catalytic subunit
MSTIRPMRPNDLLLISCTNLDHLTETYNIGFYMEYLTKWPELCQVIEGIDGNIEGYSTSSTPLLQCMCMVANWCM